MLLMWVQSHPLNTSINEKWHCRCTKRRKPDQSASRASFCMSGLQVFVTVLLQKMIIWISLHIDNKLLPSAWLVSTPSVLLFPGVLFQALDIEIPIYIFLWLVTCFRVASFGTLTGDVCSEDKAMRAKKKIWKKCSQNPPALFQSRHHTPISPIHTCHVSLWGCPRHISRPWFCMCVEFICV